MAKKVSRPASVQKVSPGADPYAKSSSEGKTLGKILGPFCLLGFIFFEQLWVGTLVCALVFAALFGIQVFREKSTSWYASPYFYATALTLILAYAEFQYQIITKLFNR